VARGISMLMGKDFNATRSVPAGIATRWL